MHWDGWWMSRQGRFLDIYPQSGWSSYCKISRSLEAARFVFNLSKCFGILQAPRQHLSLAACQIPERYDHFNIIILRLWDFATFGGRTSYRLMNNSPDIKYIFAWVSQVLCNGCHWILLYYSGWKHHVTDTILFYSTPREICTQCTLYCFLLCFDIVRL